MKGVSVIDLVSHADQRGRLTVFDPRQLPFEVRHVFFIHDVPGSAVRGEHAGSADEALIAIQGDVLVDLDNGEEQMTVHLARPDQVLYIHAGVYLQLRKFSPQAILLAVASQPYDDWLRFDEPQPQLLAT